MKARLGGGVLAVVVGIAILLYGWIFLGGTLEELDNLSYYCETPQSGVYAGNPNACYYEMITGTVIGGVLFAGGLLVVRWGWRVASRPSNPDT